MLSTFYSVVFFDHHSDNSLSYLEYSLRCFIQQKYMANEFSKMLKLEHKFLFCDFMPGNRVTESQQFSLKKSAGTASMLFDF